MYLLDTNVVSELRKPKPHGTVLAWLQGVDDTQLYLSVVTIGEIQAGIKLTREQEPAKAQKIEAWLGLVASTYGVLPMDAAAFKRWAQLMHRKSDCGGSCTKPCSPVPEAGFSPNCESQSTQPNAQQ
jgi:toxin FitB